MLSIRRLFIDQQLESSAEPNPLERAVQFEAPELPPWIKQARLSPSEEDGYIWEIAERRWIEAIFQSLSAYYGMLDVPPFKLIDCLWQPIRGQSITGGGNLLPSSSRKTTLIYGGCR